MHPPSTMHPETLIVGVIQMLEREYREREELTYHERREFEALEGELRLLQAFMKDSTKNDEETSEVFRERRRQIRELAYELEDTVETCLIKKAARTSMRRRAGIFIEALVGIYNRLDYSMAREVRSIREKKVKRIIDMLEKDLGRVESIEPSLEKPFTEVISDEAQMEQRSAVIELNKLVPFEDETTVISRIMEEKTRLDVISITGMPGLGKTTFVTGIYHNEAIRRKFPLCIWIHVSPKFDSRDTFVKILERLIPKGKPMPSIHQLISSIRKKLADKHFLLVIDDVWTFEDWEIIHRMLPKENTLGRVVVTTRRRDIAVHANIFREPYVLSLLGRERSLELLKLEVFGDCESCPPELEDISQKIADKCSGLPLSLVVVGRLLKNQFTKTLSIIGLQEEWSKVLDNVDQFLMDDKNNSIWKAFRLSYNDMPNSHKACLLYAGLFAEERDIQASTLTRLWIDEGFVRRKGLKFEEVASETILDDLVNRNLIVVTTKILDRVRTCRVHHIIREFCRAKAVEENFFEVLKENEEGMMDKATPDARRLCLHSDPSKWLSVEPSVPRIRSLLCFLDEAIDVDPKLVSTIINSFDVLRIFHCMSINLGEIPNFSRLLLLKHISLSLGSVDVVPAHIAKLPKLQTFVVHTDPGSIIRVKADLSKMSEVRSFKTNAVFALYNEKWKGKGCNNLDTLSNLSPQSCSQRLGRKARNLKNLGIRGHVVNLFRTFSLENDFPLLKKLKLVNESSFHDPILSHGIWRASHYQTQISNGRNTCLHWHRSSV